MPDLPLTARYARSTALGWQAFLLAFAAAGLALLLAGFVVEARGLRGTPFWQAGLLLLVIFGALWMRARAAFADPDPVITISAASFHDRRLGPPIPWSEIRSLERLRPGSRIFLQIGVDDPARWLANAGLLTRPMLRLNPAMGFTAVATRLDGLDVAQEMLAEAAEAALAASR